MGWNSGELSVHAGQQVEVIDTREEQVNNNVNKKKVNDNVNKKKVNNKQKYNFFIL